MLRLSKDDVEKTTSNTGEVDCLLWKNVKFSWDSNINNIDQYIAEGPFVIIPNKSPLVYSKLIISADFINNVFFLKTGRGSLLTIINTLK